MMSESRNLPIQVDGFPSRVLAVPSTSPPEGQHGLPDQYAHGCTPVAPQGLVQQYATNTATLATSRALHSVPVECLLNIFRLAAAYPQSEIIRPVQLTKFMGVCLHWREIIVGSPLLWTDIHLSRNIEFVRLCLERSRNTHINLHLPYSRTRPRVNFDLLVPLLVPHHSRILRFDLNFLPGDEARGVVSQTLSAALPVVVSLTVGNWYTRLALPTLDLDRLPSLRILKMRHILVLAIPLHLSHLTSLTLSDIRISIDSHWSHLTEPHDVLNLLESCTSIEMFTYKSGHSRAMRPPPVTPEVDEGRIVELRSIKRLYMCGTLSMTSGVMAHLSLPNNARIRLKVTDLEWDLDEDPRRPMLQAVLPVNATNRIPSLQHLRHVAVSVSPLREVVIYAESERADLFGINLLKLSPISFPKSIDDICAVPMLCVSFATPSGWRWEDVVRHLVGALLDEIGGGGILPSPIETLVLQGAIQGTVPHDWRRILTALSQIEYFHINSDFSSLLSVLTVFPRGTSDLAALTLCPRLGDLVLTCEGADEYAWRAMFTVLVVLFRERHAQGGWLNNLRLNLHHPTFEPPPRELELARNLLQTLVENVTISYSQ